jgi:hypothetical protein
MQADCLTSQPATDFVSKQRAGTVNLRIHQVLNIPGQNTDDRTQRHGHYGNWQSDNVFYSYNLHSTNFDNLLEHGQQPHPTLGNGFILGQKIECTNEHTTNTQYIQSFPTDAAYDLQSINFTAPARIYQPISNAQRLQIMGQRYGAMVVNRPRRRI